MYSRGVIKALTNVVLQDASPWGKYASVYKLVAVVAKTVNGGVGRGRRGRGLGVGGFVCLYIYFSIILIVAPYFHPTKIVAPPRPLCSP
jgi:hypothetical protein